MTTYINKRKDSPISSVEFSPMPDGNLSIFHLNDNTFSQVGEKPGKDAVREMLTTQLGQGIVAESEINGRPVIITRGAKSQEDILKALETRGDRLALPDKKHQFRPWVWRGNLSMVGQVLQLISSFTTVVLSDGGKGFIAEKVREKSFKNLPAKALDAKGAYAPAEDFQKISKFLADGKKSKTLDKAYIKEVQGFMNETKINTYQPSHFQTKGMDSATFGFAGANIAANLTNIAFGAQKISDPHQLRWLKENFNTKLAQYLPQGAILPSPEEKRAPLRTEPPEPKALWDKFRGFMQRNSVTVGEIGLRYFGAINLAFPMDKWKSVVTKMDDKGKPINKSRFDIAYNSADKFTGRAGLAYIVGKGIALFSKVPDPFDPKPHTWVDTVREKVVFRLSSLTESVAAGIIAYDRYKSRRIILPHKAFIPQNMRGKVIRDWFGSVGGALFVGGLIIRIFAPFGSKEMHMDELYAHITDGLAKVPREKLPQALAETAASIKEHFKDKVPEFGKIFNQLTIDLYRYHNIALPHTPADVQAIGAEIANLGQESPAKTKIFATPDLKKAPALVASRGASHQERLANSPETAALGI